MNVLLVQASGASDESSNVAMLNALGHSVRIRLDTDSEDSLGADFIIVSESVSSANVLAKYGFLPLPVLTLEPGLVDDWFFAAAGSSNGTDFSVVQDDQRWTGSTTNGAYTANAFGSVGEVTAGLCAGAIVYANNAASGNPQYFSIPKGAPLTSGRAIDLRIFLGFDQNCFPLNDSALRMFEAAVRQLAKAARPRKRRRVLFVSGGGGTTFFQNVGGTLTPVGSLSKRTNKNLLGTLTPAGAITKRATKTFTGTLTPVGGLTKQTRKSFAGTLTPSGSLAVTLVFLKAVAGTLTPVGSLTKMTIKALAGVLSPVGTLVKQTRKVLAGTLSPAGALTKQTSKKLTGTVTPTGTLTPAAVILKALAGTLSFIGSLATLFIPFVPPSGTIRRYWRSIWSRQWRDPGQKDIDN